MKIKLSEEKNAKVHQDINHKQLVYHGYQLVYF